MTGTKTPDLSRREAWLVAARPHTLPAAAAPVVVGTGLAVHHGVFAPLPALAALVGALLIQVGTNLANDYFDARTGVDTDESEGYTRVTQAGLVPPAQVRRATAATFGLAVLVGAYLVAVGGVPIAIIGLAGVASGVLYAGGPFPLGSHGLGDLFVFVFFGLAAVAGTFYVQAVAAGAVGLLPLSVPPGTLPPAALVAALAPAGISTAILVVNNVRDLETDRAAGKHTLAVMVGYRASRAEYVAMVGLAYVAPLWFLAAGYGPLVLLPLLTLPYATAVARTVLTERSGEPMNRALERTGRLLAAHSALFALGMAA